MCRSTSDGGRRCPGTARMDGGSGTSSPRTYESSSRPDVDSMSSIGKTIDDVAISTRLTAQQVQQRVSSLIAERGRDAVIATQKDVMIDGEKVGVRTMLTNEAITAIRASVPAEPTEAQYAEAARARHERFLADMSGVA